MNLCSDKHEEVCFESKVCPVCDVRDDLQDTIDDLEKQVASLTDEVDSLSD